MSAAIKTKAIKSRKDLQNLREAMTKAYTSQTSKIIVCGGTGCVAGGSLKIYENLKAQMENNGLNVEVSLEKEPHDNSIGLKKSGCHGFCEMGPLVRIEPQGWLYTKVKVDDCNEIVEKTIKKGECVDRLAYRIGDEIYRKQEEIPFYKQQTRVVLEHCGKIDADSINEYIAIGGYEAFEKALFDMQPDDIVSEISLSMLRGRGGGGFPTGKKWEQVRRAKGERKYIVCNGDEGDPGAFMDRSIMEGDPHRMLEGMMIAGVAVGAQEGYIYVRAEYPLAVRRLMNAIAQAEELGLLGDDIMGSGFSFRIYIAKGAGAFVCGEGSALTASIGGKRGFPRVKPPRTTEHGLFDSPTVLNNVETFATVSQIISKGAKWYLSIGTPTSPGTKAFALTGNITNTGLIEVPMGTTLRKIIFDIGGGMRGDGEFKAVQIGGPSGACLTKDHLDLPLDFDTLKKIGAMIGSGGLVVMDSHTCMVEVARFFMHFTQNESCGKCVPCREGTKRMLEILERIVEGNGNEGDIELLEELSDTISNTALCGLGKSAPNPVVSTISNFREEYETHVYEKKCPARQCQKLKKIYIDPLTCKGCSACSRKCPVGAISGKIKEPFSIDLTKCIRCGSCIATCKFNAIKEV